MIVRDAVAGDLPGVRDIYNAAVRDTTAIWNEVQVDVANRADWMAARVGQGYPVLVACDGDAVLGYATFGDWRPHDGYRATVEHSVYVASDARGRGVARALMMALIDRARGCGKHVMVGAVEAGNAPSLALHRSLGFREAGVMRQVGQKFGRWLDLAWVELVLDGRDVP